MNTQILAPVRTPYPVERMSAWRAKYDRLPVEVQLGLLPVTDPDAPERSRARFETLIAVLAFVAAPVVAFTR